MNEEWIELEPYKGKVRKSSLSEIFVKWIKTFGNVTPTQGEHIRGAMSQAIFEQKVLEKIREDEFKGGTCCPECGLRQPHIHLGWLILDHPKKSELKDTFNENGICRKGVLFTQVICEDCGVNSTIVRVMPEQSSDTLKALEEAIRAVYGP